MSESQKAFFRFACCSVLHAPQSRDFLVSPCVVVAYVCTCLIREPGLSLSLLQSWKVLCPMWWPASCHDTPRSVFMQKGCLILYTDRGFQKPDGPMMRPVPQ